MKLIIQIFFTVIIASTLLVLTIIPYLFVSAWNLEWSTTNNNNSLIDCIFELTELLTKISMHD